ncbi:MAG: dTMP kinase [Desulfitobacteriaceae bacterium]
MLAENIRDRQRKGKFIVLEGVDGSGLSTQAGRLHAWLEQETGSKVLLTKEPSEGPVGVLIRQALSGRVQGLGADTLALLFAADRVDHLTHSIIPALEKGHHVICDRYLLSSLAYQGRSLPLEWLKQINAEAIVPDLTIFISVDPVVTLKRIAEKRFKVDLFERENILREVLNNYDILVQELCEEGQNVLQLNGNRTLEIVSNEVLSKVQEYFMIDK